MAHLYLCALEPRTTQKQVKMQMKRIVRDHRQRKLADTATFRLEEWIKAISLWKEIILLMFPFNQTMDTFPAQFVKFE